MDSLKLLDATQIKFLWSHSYIRNGDCVAYFSVIPE